MRTFADPKWKDRFVRAPVPLHVYMLSLISSIAEHAGAEKAEAWAKVWWLTWRGSRRAVTPIQVKAVAAGECAM